MKKEFKTNRNKYSFTKPINYKIVNNFLYKNKILLSSLKFDSILDVGCGEGKFLHYNSDLVNNKHCCAMDLDPKEIETAKFNIPFCELKVGSIYNIPYEANTFDVVVCTEVFEHLENPDKAIDEICRVSKDKILISVPNEPLWRILNLLRFKYIKQLGNTPGHLNHWSTKSFKRFVQAKINVIDIKKPIPWTIILGKK